MKVTNTTGGSKVVNSAPPAILTPGETMDLEISEAELEVMRKTGWFEIEGDDDGDKLVSLSGKNKAELLEIAEAEGVEIEEGATVADIKSAIELHRES